MVLLLHCVVLTIVIQMGLGYLCYRLVKRQEEINLELFNRIDCLRQGHNELLGTTRRHVLNPLAHPALHGQPVDRQLIQ